MRELESKCRLQDSDPLELESQVLVSLYAGAGN